MFLTTLLLSIFVVFIVNFHHHNVATQPLFPAPIYPMDQQQGQFGGLWPFMGQQQFSSSQYFPGAPYGRGRIGNGAYGYAIGNSPFLPSPYMAPQSSEASRPSAFAQGIESGFGQLFPRYSGPAAQYAGIGQFSRRFIPGAGPNSFNGYGTNSNSWMMGMGGGGGGGPFTPQYATHQFIAESLFDRENFQSRGCGWDQGRGLCADLLGICKGGCQDFAFNQDALLHDCRCVPVGYSALLAGGKRQ